MLAFIDGTILILIMRGGDRMTKFLLVIAVAGMIAIGMLTAALAKTPAPGNESGVIVNTPWWCQKCAYLPGNPSCKSCPHGPYNPEQK
jgi:hypothetical protein